MDKEQEKWAIFWCDLLKKVIFDEIAPEDVNRYLKSLAGQAVVFPDGRSRRPSLSSLRRKLDRYRSGGFDALARKNRSDRGHPRSVSSEVIQSAIEIKTDQPRRSPEAINRLLNDMYGVSIPESTLYRHLKQAGATRTKLGVLNTKVRKRWSRDHTHDLWVGDFSNGTYVFENNQVVPTYLSAFIDCHSRYGIEARYYPRENLDVLIDSFIRALSVHGAPLAIYVDNAKIYHSNSLKAACYRIGINLLHRPPKDPPAGGLIERFIQNVQNQFEAEVRAGQILSLADLNRGLSAWLHVSYHQRVHSETGQSPQERYQKGLTVLRRVDMQRVTESFLHTAHRTVHKSFSDVRLDNRLYRVDSRLRGDRIEVRFDPFSMKDTVDIYCLKGKYLGIGHLHFRQEGDFSGPEQQGKAKHNYINTLVREHKKSLGEKANGIDYRKLTDKHPWPFHELARTVADLLGRQAGLAGLTTHELEMLQKLYNKTKPLNRSMIKKAFENALQKSVPYLVRELNLLIEKE